MNDGRQPKDATDARPPEVMGEHGSVIMFLHIPKTAGTTLSKCIFLNQPSDGQTTGESETDQPAELTAKKFVYDGVYYYPIGFFKDPNENAPEHVAHCLSRSDLRAVLGHFSFGLHRLIKAPVRYITMLRDPVERVVSLYHHLRTTGVLGEIAIKDWVEECPEEMWAVRLDGWLPLPEAFSEEEIRRCSRAIVDNDQVRRIAGIEPGFGECTARHLQDALRNLRESFSLVGCCERFDESLILARRRLGWEEMPLYLPRLVNRKKPTLDSLPSSVIQAIEDRNALDRELYRRGQEMLDEAIEEEGPGFHEELAEFRRLNQEHMERYRAEAGRMGLF